MQLRNSWLTRANALTCIRFAAVPAVVAAIEAEAAWLALAVFALAVATDVADGIVARRFEEQSGFGRLFDHAADAAFVTAGAAALAHAGVLPPLLPTLIAVSFIQYALDAKVTHESGPRPSRLGRWNGIAYYAIVAIPIARDALEISWPTPALILMLGWLLVGSTLVSMGDRLIHSRSRAASRKPDLSAGQDG
ncbi:MAG: CDP-alcohol phosphatidyltransferase family protein [Deltaproteobacteria bacterium]|jgi:phosphatidylglycerophosphate synthase|nr:CDP-alcohol phosphatidyltransferase family protein [Deltaproteobacteria bacterium]MBW2542603.1 CDP-alcohol phosphatidyltransferase family protein [Deltaproteobacteria bacterium]